MNVVRPVFDSAMTLWDGIAFAGSVLILLIHGHVWFGLATGYGRTSGENLNSVFFIAYALSLAILAIRPGPVLLGLFRSPFLLVLLGLSVASIYWSIAPEITARRVPALLFTSLGGLAIAARWPWPRFVEILATTFTIMGIMSFVLGLIFPDLGRMSEIFPGAWRGVWLEKNSLGGMMALAALVQLSAAAINPGRRMLWSTAAALSIALVLLSTSKTSLLVLLLGLSAQGFMLFVKGGPVRAIVGSWLAVVAVGTAVGLLVFENALFFDLLGKDATLTGRTTIWSGILRQMPGQELTGFGFGAFWDNTDQTGPVQRVASEAFFTPAHAHNGWLEIMLAIGYPGVVVFGLWLMQMWVTTVWALYASRVGWFLLPFMIAYTISMLTESVTLNAHDPWWVMFVAVAVRAVIGDPAPPVPHPANARFRARPHSALRTYRRRRHSYS